MRVWQPGGHLVVQRGDVKDWSWRQTRRRLAALARLTAPYKWRTALALGSLLAATVTALMPPYLAKLAIDNGIRPHDLHLLTLFVIAFLAATVYYGISRALPWVLQYAVAAGVIYGVIVYFFMNRVVVPLSAARKFPFSLKMMIIGVTIHIFCVGLPIAIIARRFSARTP